MAKILLLMGALVLMAEVIFFRINVFAEETISNESDASLMTPPLVRCNRKPADVTVLPGTNGFKISLSGSPEKYVPGETYTVKLHGTKISHSIQKFTQFSLIVESSPRKGRPASINQDVGSFQLIEDGLSKFSEECPNMVIQSSVVPKSEIEVRWKAPGSDCGCVDLKVAVMETGNNLYMDDGELTKQLCEEKIENPDAQPDILAQCNTCDEAKYEVTFQGLWSRNTHPKGFPQDNWSTHFSDIVGASHSPDFTLWNYGGLASEGLKRVAEMGYTLTIEHEMKDQAESILTIIKARGLWFPNLNGSTSAVFRVNNVHHLVSLVTMIGPSPDWITGVSKLELCQEDGTWAPSRTLNLYPWDAGVDGGVTYNAEDNELEQRENIRRITTSYPNNPESPFYDPSGAPMKPLARLTMKRQRVFEKSCDSTASLSQYSEEEIQELPSVQEDDRMECAVSDWGEYSKCTVTCGEGLRARHRHYRMPAKAAMFNCNTDLKQMEICTGAAATCGEKDKWREDPIKCATSAWTEWTLCDSECGAGFRTRTRQFLDRRAFKTCRTPTTKKEKCMSHAPCDPDDNTIDPQCQVTQWSEWSPCMVTCGKGMQIRTRLYLNVKSKSMCSLELTENRPCIAEKADCNFDRQEAMKICNQPREAGPCRGQFNRWYFDTTKLVCMQFVFGGCRGNQNNFMTAEDCNQVCETLKVPIGAAHIKSQMPAKVVQHQQDDPIDCMVSPWNRWSDCTAKCGGGYRTRQRKIKVHPRNGGKSCRKRLEQKKACNNKPCQK